MIDEQVILVDLEDRELGTIEKMEAHKKGLLHRAISVFIVNSKGEWMLQQREIKKYHSGGLWTNTCCSHPKPGESCMEAAVRRLSEEMGLKADLTELFHFIYREPMDNNLTEYELDHVFIGKTDDLPLINRDEVMDWRYLSFSEIQLKVEMKPDDFTVWFVRVMDKVHQMLESYSST